MTKIDQIIELKEQGLTYPEIAKQLEITENVVAGVINRARKDKNLLCDLSFEERTKKYMRKVRDEYSRNR
tara:strand:- start:29 stop:238 length:210 start_codon:yes stop_codon:yes gene_type:complete